MKQQIIIIHGGTTFETYEEYWKYLESYEIKLENLENKKIRGQSPFRVCL